MASRVFSKINRKVFRNYLNHAKNSQSQKYSTAFGNNLIKNVEGANLKLLTNHPQNATSSLISSEIAQPLKTGLLVPQARFYSEKCESKSTDKKKCKSQERCTKLKLCHCEPSKFKNCRITVHPTNCKKREAPYPSFSEACYEEPYNKPSECKLCPWSKTTNPSFKGDVVMNKKFHTWNPRIHENNNLNLENAKQNIHTEQTTSATPVSNIEVEQSNDSPDGGILASGKCSSEKKGGKCKKFPYKKDSFEIGKKKDKKNDCNAKPVCEKKKRKLVKDCPRDGKKCSENNGSTDVLDEAMGGYLMKKKGDRKDKCKQERDCLKKDCPKKQKVPLVCPSEPLVRPAGYKRRPRKNKKKCEEVDELQLPLAAVCTDGLAKKDGMKQPQLHRDM